MDYRNIELAAEFKKVLTTENLRPLMIIHLSQAMGVISFAGVVLFMYHTSSARSGGDASLVFTLSMLHAAVGLAAFPASIMMFNHFMKKINLAPGLSPERTPLGILGAIRTASIIKVAIMESTAFFGLVASFMAVTSGVIYSQPLYWLNMISALLMVGYIALSLPTAERLVKIFQETMSAG